MRFPYLSRHPRTFHTTRNFEHVLGTSLELQFVTETEAAAAMAEKRALTEIERLECMFSRYKGDSELNVWQVSHGQWVDVSAELGMRRVEKSHRQGVSANG